MLFYFSSQFFTSIGKHMATLKNIGNYFRIKQLEDIILTAEKKFEVVSNQTGMDRETHLHECRILSMITGRQTGSTERVVKLFNPMIDIYVGENGVLISDFIRRIRLHNSNEELNVRYLNLNSKNLKETIPTLRGDGVKRVWIDVGGRGLFKKATVITCVIRTIEDQFPDLNPIYIIV